MVKSYFTQLLENNLYGIVYKEIAKATREKPVTKKRLIALTGKSEREIRDMIEELRLSGTKVGSSASVKGYWLCKTKAEYNAVRTEYITRIKSLIKVVQAMDAKLEGQLEMELFDE